MTPGSLLYEPEKDEAQVDKTSRDERSSCDSLTANTSLLVRVKMGDDDAWRRLVLLYSPLVYRLCRKCGLQQDDAEDVAQEVFRSVANSIDKFRRDPGRGSFRGWLWTIAINKIRDYARGREGRPNAIGGSTMQRQMAEVPDIDFDDMPAQPTETDEHRLLHRVMDLIKDEFEPKTWEAFLRATVKGHTAAEIAEDLGMNKPAVRQAKYRVLRRLRQEIDDLL